MAYAGLMPQCELISTENADFYIHDIMRLESPDPLDGECPVLLIVFRGYGQSDGGCFHQAFHSQKARASFRAKIKAKMTAPMATDDLMERISN